MNEEQLDRAKKNEQQMDYGTGSHAGEAVHTTLSLHPNVNIPIEDRYVYQFYNNGADPLKPNQLSVMTIDHKEKSGMIDIRALVRHSVNDSIKLGDMTTVILNDQHEVIAEGVFDLSKLGSLPANSSRPFTFRFSKKNISEKITNQSNISLALRQIHEHRLDLTEAYQETLSSAQIEKIETIMKQAPELKEGEFNLLAINLVDANERGLAVDILLRNGSKKNINLSKLPLQVFDKNKQLVAQGGFKFTDYTIKANTSKLHTFIFPKNTLVTDSYDLSNYIVKIYRK